MTKVKIRLARPTVNEDGSTNVVGGKDHEMRKRQGSIIRERVNTEYKRPHNWAAEVTWLSQEYWHAWAFREVYEVSEEQRSTVSRSYLRQHHVPVVPLLPHASQHPLLDSEDVLHQHEKAHVGGLVGLWLVVVGITM